MSTLVKASHIPVDITSARLRRACAQYMPRRQSMLTTTQYNMYELPHTIPDLAMLRPQTCGNNLGATVAVLKQFAVHVDRKPTNTVTPRSIPSPPKGNNIY